MKIDKSKNTRREFLRGAAVTAASVTVAATVSKTASASDTMNTTGQATRKQSM